MLYTRLYAGPVELLDPGGWALSEGEVVHFLQERAEVVAGGERARMEIAECLVPPLQRLAVQRLSSGEVALGLQQFRAELADTRTCTCNL